MCKLTDFELLILEKPELSCEDFDTLLGDYVEGELSESIELKLDAHLEQCPECQDGLELYQQVIDIAAVIGQEHQKPQMPQEAKERLHKKLNESLGLHLPTRA